MLRQICRTTRIDIGAQRWWTVFTVGGMFLGAGSFVLFLCLRLIGFPLSWVFGIVSIVCWLMGGISIVRLLLFAQNRRREEIAVRRLCGASRGDIRTRFLLEALLVGIPGWLVGLCLTLAALLLFNSRLAGMQISGPWLALIAFMTAFISLLVDVLFGLYPAQRAASEQHVDARRGSCL